MSYRILLVEDDDATRGHMAEVIETHAEFTLTGAARDCKTARQALAGRPPDAMLCDLGLPDGSGLDLVREAGRLSSPPAVMVISGFGDERHVVDAIKAGACAYLLKGASPREIRQAIMDMRAGGSPLSAAVARHLLSQFQPPSEQRPDHSAIGFTDRELEVLKLMAKGYAYQEVADGLTVSINTIREHIRHIYRKLAVRSRAEAVFEAQALGLIPGTAR